MAPWYGHLTRPKKVGIDLEMNLSHKNDSFPETSHAFKVCETGSHHEEENPNRMQSVIVFLHCQECNICWTDWKISVWLGPYQGPILRAKTVRQAMYMCLFFPSFPFG